MLTYRFFPAITIGALGLVLASMPAWPVDCERWPQLCIEQPKKQIAKRATKRAKKFTIRRGVEKAPLAAIPQPRGSEPVVTQVSRPAETLMYRQIVPLPVVTSAEPRIIPLPSRMPDLSSRNIVAVRSTVIPPRAVSWTRKREGIAAIMLTVTAIYIAFVAYACVPITRGMSHEQRNIRLAGRSFASALAHRLGHLGKGIGQGAPQPARWAPVA